MTKPSYFETIWQELLTLPREEKTRQPVAYTKTHLQFESSRFYLETGRKRILKNGQTRDELIPVPCLNCNSDQPILGKTEFKIVANTNMIKIMQLTKIIRRACGNEDAEKFLNAATQFLADCAAQKAKRAAQKAKSNPQANISTRKPKPLSRAFEIPASGICNRFQRGKIQTEIGLPMFEYRDQDSDPISGATLADAIKATEIVRKSLNV